MDIYLYDYGENEGSIQNGYRPVVVLQADNFNLKAPTIMVAAITTAIRKTFLPSHILVEDKFGLTDPSMIMLEQQRAVNKDELVNYVGHINDDNVLRRIHNGLMKLYGYWDYTRYNKANILQFCYLILPATHSDILSLLVCAKLGSMSKSFRMLWDIRIYQLL